MNQERCIETPDPVARVRVGREFAEAQFVEASFSRTSRRTGPSPDRLAGARISYMKAGIEQAQRRNEFGQPIGFDLPGWKPPPFPPHVALAGRYCRLEPLNAARHARDIFEAQRED